MFDPKDILDTDGALPENLLAYGDESHTETLEEGEGEDGKTRFGYVEHHEVTVSGFGIEGKGWEITGTIPEKEFAPATFVADVKAKVGAATFNRHINL